MLRGLAPERFLSLALCISVSEGSPDPTLFNKGNGGGRGGVDWLADRALEKKNRKLEASSAREPCARRGFARCPEMILQG